MIVKDLIEQYPDILNMDIDGLDFIHEGCKDEDIKDIILSFTKVPLYKFEELYSNFLGGVINYKGFDVVISSNDDGYLVTDAYNKSQSRIDDVKGWLIDMRYYLLEEYLGENVEIEELTDMKLYKAIKENKEVFWK